MPEVTKFQAFTVKRIARSQIQFAEYNPRRSSEERDEGLSHSLTRFGLSEALVWNETTGRLVGGHRRLSQLDMREKGNDYYLDVCAVKLSPQKEVQLNVLLNQSDIQGEFDLARLNQLCTEWDFDLGDFGFLSESLADDFGFGEDEEEEQQPAPRESKAERESQLKVNFKTAKELQDFCKAVGMKRGTQKVPADMLIGIMRSAFEEQKL
jgi:hypothetical protein